MYKIIATSGRAKRARMETAHGVIETPVFMNVATAGAIKGALSAFDLKNIGTQVVLANTYHLHVRPGDDVVRDMGGIRRFMNWNGPVLTDSGGFQVFSLAKMRRISEEGVTFHSHVDGRRIFMGPEESMTIQANIGATISMAFDECIKNPAPREYVAASVARTTRWLVRCRDKLLGLKKAGAAINPHQLLFGINQGGTYEDIRVGHAKEISAIGLDGYAIGGLAVGEPAEVMYHVLDVTVPHLPKDRPTYLMGVGTPANILEAVDRGVDFFDCVYPSRNGRHGHVYTDSGRLNLLNARYERDMLPIDPDCGCPVCQRYTRAYVRHLLKSGEMLGMRLCVMHNLYYYNTMMSQIRKAIDSGGWPQYKADKLNKVCGG